MSKTTLKDKNSSIQGVDEAYKDLVKAISTQEVAKLDIPLELLEPHPDQRPLSDDHVEKLASDFKLDLTSAAPLCVLPFSTVVGHDEQLDNFLQLITDKKHNKMKIPDGIRFWVIDGQHRLASVNTLSADALRKFPTYPCRVFPRCTSPCTYQLP
jgi:hypothetical protein